MRSPPPPESLRRSCHNRRHDGYYGSSCNVDNGGYPAHSCRIESLPDPSGIRLQQARRTLCKARHGPYFPCLLPRIVWNDHRTALLYATSHRLSVLERSPDLEGLLDHLSPQPRDALLNCWRRPPCWPRREDNLRDLQEKLARGTYRPLTHWRRGCMKGSELKEMGGVAVEEQIVM